jgi:prepilin-type N-terminal cleavage/methylation domain-containing protein
MNRKPNREPQTANCQRSSTGFTLIEVTIASSLLVVIALGSAQLFVLATRQTVAARQQLVMALVAARKIDELAGAAAAGPLAASPPGALDRGAEGFADVLEASGVVCVRRWQVSAVADRAGAIAIIVRVSVPGCGDVQIVTICQGQTS